MAANSASLLVFALAAFPLAVATRAIHTATPVNALASLSRLVAAVAVALILVPALRAAQVDSQLRPRRLAGYGLAAVVAAFAPLAGSIAIGEPRLVTSVRASAVLDLLAAGLWAVLAILCARAGSRRRSSSTTWSAAALALLALSALMRGSSRLDGTSWLLGAAALTVIAALVAVVNAVTDVQEALSSEGTELLTTTGALADAERLLEGVEARRQELVHDARSMIAALRAASTTLDRHAEQLDLTTTRKLRVAMDNELERLGRLIDGSTGGPARPFAVSAALAPVIATLRNAGLELEDRLDPSWAEGRPDDLAEVVHNLLANAHRHAPGSQVSVRCESDGDLVRDLRRGSRSGHPRRAHAAHLRSGCESVPGHRRRARAPRGGAAGPRAGWQPRRFHPARRRSALHGAHCEQHRTWPSSGSSHPSLVSRSRIASRSVSPSTCSTTPAPQAHPSRGTRVIGQLDDEPDSIGPGAPFADDSDVERASTEGVAAINEAVTATGQGQPDGVRQQPRPDVDQRPANRPLLSPSHHGDKHVTSGAAAPRTS